MTALTFANAEDQLNIILDDASDVTFSSSRKDRALTRAWNDSYVTNEVFDTSLTYTTGTYQYALPATLSSLQDIYLTVTGTSKPFPEPISSDLWELVNGKIQFRWQADSIIPSNYTLYLKGRYKLTTADSISDAVMQEYVLALAAVYTLTLLLHKKANLFTINDTSVGELVMMKREFENDVKDLRRRLRVTWESA